MVVPLLDWLGVALVLLTVSLGGMVWLSRWMAASEAALFVFSTVAIKASVVAFRYYIAIGGSVNVELTSDTYRYLSFGQKASHSPGHLANLLLRGDETDRIIALGGIAFKAFGDSWLAVFMAGSFFGLVAMWVFWGLLLSLDSRAPILFGYAMCVFPSSLYWSSSFGKEVFTLLGLALGLCGAGLLWNRRIGQQHLLAWLLIASGLGVLFLVRIEIAVLLGAALLGAVFVVRPTASGGQFGAVRKGRLLLALCVFPLLLLIGPQLFGFGAIELTDNLYGRYENTSIGSSQLGGDRPAGLAGLIVGIPIAVFRPFPWENGITGLASSLDTVLIALGAVCAVGVYRRSGSARFEVASGRIWIASCVVILGLFAALAGYGNLGLLVRMRSMVMPLLIIVCLLYFWTRRDGTVRTEDQNWGENLPQHFS